MIWINILTGLFLVGTGFLVKAYPNLIAGYNTMSREKKEKVDIEGLSAYMRNAFIMIGLIIVLGSFLFEWVGLGHVAYWLVIIVTIGGTIIMMIGAQRFDHNEK